MKKTILSASIATLLIMFSFNSANAQSTKDSDNKTNTPAIKTVKENNTKTPGIKTVKDNNAQSLPKVKKIKEANTDANKVNTNSSNPSTVKNTDIKGKAKKAKLSEIKAKAKKDDSEK